MRPLLLHLRVSPLRWVLIPLLVLDLALLLLRTTYWIGDWPETGAAAQVPAFFLSIIASGAAAWVSGSKSRNHLEEQLAASAIPSAKSEAYRLGASVIMVMIPYLSGHAVAFILTARTFPPGIYLWVGYVLLGAVVMLLATAWGWILGKYFGSAYAALVALLTWFMFQSFIGRDLSVTSGPPWKEVSLAGASMLLLTVLVLCVAILWLPSLKARWNVRWKGALTISAAVAVLAAISSMPAVRDRDAPADPICVDGAIKMCLWPERVKYLPIVENIDSRVRRLPDGLRLPAQLNEYGIDRIQYNVDGRAFTQLEGGFDISEGSKWSVAHGVSSAIVSKTLETCDRDAMVNAEDFTAEAIRRWIEAYLAGDSTPDYTTRGVPDKMADAWAMAGEVARHQSRDDQMIWMKQQLTRLKERYCG